MITRGKFYDSLFFLVSVFRHTLLDAKITNVLSLCHDQVILSAVQNIIQNMITLEDGSQQQPHYLQSVGFGGLWRFAGPFTKVGFVFIIGTDVFHSIHPHTYICTLYICTHAGSPFQCHVYKIFIFIL